MRISVKILVGGLMALGPVGAIAATPTPSPPVLVAVASTANRSYVLGLKAGKQLKDMGVAIDAEAMMAGVKDALASAKPRFTDEQILAVLSSLQSDIVSQRQAKTDQLTNANKSQGAAYLKSNGARPGVITLASGLEYEILNAGKGARPKLTDTVSCQYVGTLIDGVQFDASDKAGPPASFRVDGVIKGWTEVLQLMPVGSKWRVVIPAELAYGDHGAGEQIGPGATLIFEVELVGIAAG